MLKISTIKPIKDYVLIEPAESKTQTESGIYLPENDKEKPQHGTVVAVGDESFIEVGAQVIYKKWSGHDVKVDDKEYQFLKVEDVLAIIEEK